MSQDYHAWEKAHNVGGTEKESWDTSLIYNAVAPLQKSSNIISSQRNRAGNVGVNMVIIHNFR